MLSDKLSAAVAAHRMFASGELVVVGVSGGPDSVALLHGLSVLSGSLGIGLYVAHLNHMLRGPESVADAHYVESLARSLGWPAVVEARDVAALRRRYRVSLEEAARLARYAFFQEVVQRRGAVGVAVGHTADDQVETIVLHWLRGAGLSGLRGMRPVTLLRVGFPGNSRREPLRVLRPLLDASRTEVDQYCREHGLHPREDITNRDPRFVRNRIRLQLLPQLTRFNPQFRKTVLRQAQVIATEDDFLAEQVAALWPKVTSVCDGYIEFSLAIWDGLSRNLQYRLLREAILALRGDLLGISTVHVETGVQVMNSKPAGSIVHLPYGLRLVKRYSDFRLTSVPPRQSALSLQGEQVAIPGLTVVASGLWQVAAELVEGPYRPISHDPKLAALDFRKTGHALRVRRRRPGDRFQPLGMADQKKVQDFLVDTKVPRAERDEVPVVSDDGRIVWLVGLRIAEWAKVERETRTTLLLRFNRLIEEVGQRAEV